MEEIVELKVKLENIQLPVVSSMSRQMSLKRHNSNKLSPAGKYTHRIVGSNESGSSVNSEIPCHQQDKQQQQQQQQKETTVGVVEACDTDGHPAVVVDSSPFKMPRNPMLSNLDNSAAQSITIKSSSSKLSRSVSRVQHREPQDYTYDVIECDSQTPTTNNQKVNVDDDDDDDDDRDDDNNKSKQTSSKVFLNLFLIN